MAAGRCSGLAATRAEIGPLAPLVGGGIGMTLGRNLREGGAPGCGVVATGGVPPNDLESVAGGAVARPAEVVPAIIQSLLF